MKTRISFVLSVVILFVLSLPVPLIYFLLLQDAVATHLSTAAASQEGLTGAAVPVEITLLKELGFLSVFIPVVILIVPFIRARGEENLRKHKLLLSLGLFELSFNTAYAALALLMLVREWNQG